MKRFHIAFVSGTNDYVLLEYNEEDYKKAKYDNNESLVIKGGFGNTICGFYDYSKYEEIYLNVGCTSLGNLSVINNTYQFFDGFKPYKTEVVISVKCISECISKAVMVQQIYETITRLQKTPKSPYRDCIEKYYTDMRKFVESVEVDE